MRNHIIERSKIGKDFRQKPWLSYVNTEITIIVIYNSIVTHRG
jgi:hypothetical protein